MSFILDALKKSETERQRHDAPGISDVPLAPSSNAAPKWLWVVAILLAGNLVAITFILLWPERGPAEAGVDRQPSQVAAEPAARPTPPAAPAAAREPAPQEQPPAQEQPAAQERPAPPRSTVTRPATATSVATPPPATAPATATVTTGLPTFNEVRANGTLSLPDLHLDIHVYSDQPSGRFVFINMKKYEESSRLAEGPSVREITPDGVVLEHTGTRFLLPRE